MQRRCADCEWGSDELSESLRLVCREGPEGIPVSRDHWCGRFRMAERLAEGKDVRVAREA